MRLTESEGQLMRGMASMPFLDRLEMAAVSGRSLGSVYGGMEKLEAGGVLGSIPHASDLIPPTRRFYLTAAGLRLLAEIEGVALEDLFPTRPVSAQWQRVLLGRLDALAVIYRVVATLSGITHPVPFRWYRAMPMDAAVTLSGGRTIALLRQGPTSDRTAFAKRLWRLREQQPGAVLLLLPDEVRLRHARRLLTNASTMAFLALERVAATGRVDSLVWRIPSGGAVLDLREAMTYAGPGRPLPTETRPRRWSLPGDLGVESSKQDPPDPLLPLLLKPAEKRALDLLSDWPGLTPAHLGGLLGVKRSRLSQVLQRLKGLGLVVATVEGRSLLALGDRGLGFLARRDRAAVGAARRRWSVTPINPGAPLTWRNVSGSRSRQLLRNLDHTQAVHGFVTALARQSRCLGWDVVQLDPPRRASRYFRYGDRPHSVRPDAFGILRRGGTPWPFFLEWERRAVRPVTMAARLAPYLRYYSSRQPLDDHGAMPALLVVFDDELAAGHFLRVAREQMAQARVKVPLWVSHRSALEQAGPLGRAWQTPGAWEPVNPLPVG